MREPTPQEIASFKKGAEALAKLGKKGFWIYLAEDSLHLMVCPSHDLQCRPKQDGIRATVRIPQAGGGDW